MAVGIVTFAVFALNIAASAAIQLRTAAAVKVERYDGKTGANVSEPPLTEAGYQQVLQLSSVPATKAFVARLLAAEGRTVTRDKHLEAFARIHGGVPAKTLPNSSFAAMLADLRSPKSEIWVDEGLAREAPLDEAGYSMVASTKDNIQMRIFLRRVLRAKARKVLDWVRFDHIVSPEGGLLGTSTLAEALSVLEPVSVPLAEWQDATGYNVPLTEEGFQRVQKMNSNADMEQFMRRVVYEDARTVKDQDWFRAVVPYYSGALGDESFATLMEQIRDPLTPWVAAGVGRTAPLNEEGYQLVAATRKKKQMEIFCRRILQAENREINDQRTFSSVVKYHSGESAVQTFEKARQDLLVPLVSRPRA